MTTRLGGGTVLAAAISKLEAGADAAEVVDSTASAAAGGVGEEALGTDCGPLGRPGVGEGILTGQVCRHEGWGMRACSLSWTLHSTTT
eukprot:1135656-Pleurochrysis_carterae.AAC.1